tara:strand:+ start:1679 stop:1891 length:213 start_codon:yes stop_codon:yes gene_type:complete
MSFEFFILNGYGQFVWPAFVFTFLSCVLFYLKTRKELQKQERLYLKTFGPIQSEKIELKRRKEVLSAKSI